MFHSAPRSVERGDQFRARSLRSTSPGFNPRPAQSSGATLSCLAVLIDRRRFNPRPAQSSGATDRAICAVPQSVRVSIRAPLSRAGRPGNLPTTAAGSCRFKLRRPAQSSGATQRRPISHINGSLMFKSAPRSVERGDEEKNGNNVAIRHVSIRAPLSRAGRPHRTRSSPNPLLFQSAPRSVERGDPAKPRK